MDFIKNETQISRFQHLIEGCAELRQCQPLAPVNIEDVSMRACRPEFQDIAPPPVLQRRCHVVWHDIQDDAHPGGLQGGHQHLEITAPANGGIDLVGIGHIIAVRRAGYGGEDRREVEMADAEILPIGHELAGMLEGHAVSELQSVGG